VLSPFAKIKPVRHRIPIDRLASLSNIDWDHFSFPKSQTIPQFVAFYTSCFAAFMHNSIEGLAAIDALISWNKHCFVDSGHVRLRKPSHSPDFNRTEMPPNPDVIKVANAAKAAKLGPFAKMSDLLKTLRASPALSISDPEIVRQIIDCIPPSTAPHNIQHTPCEPPIFGRKDIAAYINSKSPNSHPGPSGLTFSSLQLFVKHTYGMEDDAHPSAEFSTLVAFLERLSCGQLPWLDPWSILCSGVIFNKNADDPSLPVKIRNLGIEESLVRVTSKLVGDQVVPDAITNDFISKFDFGVSRRAGTEIFARISHLNAAQGGAIICADCSLAFNRVRRSDMLTAVLELNNSLLTAWFCSRFKISPIVVFKGPRDCQDLVMPMPEGILQGDPLSSFLFSLTMAYILRPLRLRYPNILFTSYADDLNTVVPAPLVHLLPAIATEFKDLLTAHGLVLNFDSDKSFVFSLVPLPLPSIQELLAIGLRCNNDGMAPCKIPFGTVEFISKKIDKAILKLRSRAAELHRLWEALTIYSRSNSFADLFVNIVRNCFSSIPVFYLRTCPPWATERLALIADSLLHDLLKHIRLPVFAPHFPSLAHPPVFLPLLSISDRIEELPLTEGGLSLCRASSIRHIAFVSSVSYCLPFLRGASDVLNSPFDLNLISDFPSSSAIVATSLALDSSFWLVKEGVPHLQKELTALHHSREVASILATLEPLPHHSNLFMARRLPYASYALNSRARFIHGTIALNNQDFMRALAFCTLRVAVSPGRCSCGAVVDPVGWHYSCCSHIHYGFLHDTIRDALASRLKLMLTAADDSSQVVKEKPVSDFYRFAPPVSLFRQEVRVADIVISHDKRGCRDVYILDIVTASSTQRNPQGSCHSAADAKVTLKKRTYSQYAIAPDRFWPISIERSGAIPPATLSFFEYLSASFSLSRCQANSLIHVLSRSCLSGMAQSISRVAHRAELHSLGALSAQSLFERNTANVLHSDARARAARNALWRSPQLLISPSTVSPSAPPGSQLPARDRPSLLLWASLSKNDLKSRCRDASLSATGSKDDLMNRLVVHFGAMPPPAPEASLLPVSPAVLVSQPRTHLILLPRAASFPPEVPHQDVAELPPMSDLFSAPLTAPMAFAETLVEPTIRETAARALSALGDASGAPAVVLLDRPGLSRVWTFGSLLGRVTAALSRPFLPLDESVDDG
jgi:hypothetical protein